ncbi:hypothetical protein GLOIN_2v1764044 [Rhizophagus clarus]|uniref:Uncharacterized protein n=2 Tax=Rhizophagus clarus TaxID=94130 RepID=A0A8H3LN87_9GLOM|nr:hypothetical protein GLOIN_2v1764044 [Rhizophagus clarus]
MLEQNIYAREYQIGTYFLCQRKSYSRVYDPKTKHKIYNDLQLSKLNKANNTYLYGMDFSKKFNYCLCSICYNLLARLKKSKPPLTNQSKMPKSSPKSDQATRLTKSKLQGSNNSSYEKKKDQASSSNKSSDHGNSYKVEEIGVNEINKVEETDKVKETDDMEDIDEIEKTDEVKEIDEIKFERSL